MINIIYLKICTIYNVLFSVIQNIFLKKKIVLSKIESELITKGYELFSFNNNLSEIYKIEKKIQTSKYISKEIIHEETIFQIIDYIFIKNKFAEKVSEITGFSYSIDFIVGYETFNIPIEDQNNNWYANKWHNDKPFTRNTLKFIVPLINEKTSYQSGGIEILDKKQTNEYIKSKKIPKIENIFIMKNLKNELLIFNPNICYHKAGNPTKNNSRRQLMFQLNPSSKWKINSNIYKKQFKIEPKFPSLSYLLDETIIMKI